VLDPADLLERCGRDAVRWYLLRDIPFGDDGDFQQQRFSDLVNNDLANTIGNLLNRTSSMARRWFEECVPPPMTANGSSHPLAQDAAKARSTVLTALEQLEFRSAAEAALQLAIAANGFLNEQAPWSRMKQEGSRDQVADDLYAVLEAARITALLMAPLLPDLSERMLLQLGQSVPDSGVDAPRDGGWLHQLEWGGLQSGAVLPEPSPVMARLELDAPL
jgi:methionyl-tRNA synthetase